VSVGVFMSVEGATRAVRPFWATCLGVLAVLFGAMFAAAQTNEWMVQRVIAPDSVAAQNIPADCREDEAEEEGISVDECELMVANVRIMIASRPAWFRSMQSRLVVTGALVALWSILAGVSLVDYRAWAPAAAAATFAALIAIDMAQFVAALYTGPLLRALYLWNITVWITIHLCLLAGALAGRRFEQEPGRSPAVVAA
jgi:hypothetical protein